MSLNFEFKEKYLTSFESVGLFVLKSFCYFASFISILNAIGLSGTTLNDNLTIADPARTKLMITVILLIVSIYILFLADTLGKKKGFSNYDKFQRYLFQSSLLQFLSTGG